LKERDGNGPSQKLVMLEVEASDADASGYEPVWNNDNLVGFVTSGGYGHTVNKSLAMALINSDLAKEGQNLKVHVVGVEKDAKVIQMSPYDPEGSVMRV
ncbi:MAG: aminomethyl transferase family protein, partial [Rhodobacterales bacterium]|nr:aminomethyl transferase family protein [Rhodobacterales bacterium]